VDEFRKKTPPAEGNRRPFRYDERPHRRLVRAKPRPGSASLPHLNGLRVNTKKQGNLPARKFLHCQRLRMENLIKYTAGNPFPSSLS